MSANPYETNLDKTPANYQPLTPISFLERAASVYPAHTAIIHGKTRVSYAGFYARARRLASALACHYIGRGDTVSVMLANTPPMLDAHYGVPMTGAVLHCINTRLDAATIAFQLDHANSTPFWVVVGVQPKPGEHDQFNCPLVTTELLRPSIRIPPLEW